MAENSSMTGDDIIGELQQWCLNQAAKSACNLKKLESKMEGRLKDIEGRMNSLCLNIATQVASDVNSRMENCLRQNQMDMQDFKSQLNEEIKTAVKEEFKQALLRAAGGMEEKEACAPMPCQSTPLPPPSTPLAECCIEEQEAEASSETRFVQSMEDLPTEWHENLLPFLPKQLPKSERLNLVQVAFLNYLITKKQLRGNKDCANMVIQEGRKLNIWSALWKPPGITKSFQEYVTQKIININKRAKLSLSRRQIDLDAMNNELEKRTNSLMDSQAQGHTEEEESMILEEGNTDMEGYTSG